MTLDGVGVRVGVWLRARGILLFVPPVRSVRENCRNSRDFAQPTGKAEFYVRCPSLGARCYSCYNLRFAVFVGGCILRSGKNAAAELLQLFGRSGKLAFQEFRLNLHGFLSVFCVY